MMQYCIDYKYLDLYLLLGRIRLQKALKIDGLFGSDEWIKIINNKDKKYV